MTSPPVPTRFGAPAKDRAGEIPVERLLELVDRVAASGLAVDDQRDLWTLLEARPGVERALRRRVAVEHFNQLRCQGLPTRKAATLAGRKFGAHPQTIRQRWGSGSPNPVPLLPGQALRVGGGQEAPEEPFEA